MGVRGPLIVGGVLVAAIGAAIAAPDAVLPARAAPYLQDMRARIEALLPDLRRAPVAAARLPQPRTAVEDGRNLVRLTDQERKRIGLVTETRSAVPHPQELTAYGSVLDIARITELANSYAGAVAALQMAEARVAVSGSAARRARNLGAGVVAVAQIETAEGTLLTDRAAQTGAESQVRTLSATARQEWGSVLGKAIIDRAPLVTRLIERADFLVQVTLPPGESLASPPQAAFAEVPPQSERVSLRLVSPATRTDPRIQGQSFFYLVSGDSGLLPGTSTMAFLPAERSVRGVLVPEDAVVHGEGGTWVYRGTGDGAFVRHPIRPDAPMSADSFVVEDLPDGAEIVLRGGQALMSEEMKGRIRVVGDDDD
ncbi:efflux RND transporter periplasmic adaptor subunit [Methylobacterium sp. J-030]|uniref:efflux RND transporter periplasmic adaptor subunit n=1 Tax=Methylobacterium sp. J-030 TaxID=2836627 RepID=UPI001FB8F4C5|nr:efflux RND transporter periplasmic adaptor subunit [Methylobacterium sp. J-030]MCJ2068095.1 efflux RND transporter periplasmic adaptor subunit [Methylobacterium sp. J-030]